MKCNDIRDELAIDPTGATEDIQVHLAQCEACSTYARRHETLDALLQVEMHWQVPTALTAQLLAIAATAPIGEPVIQPVPRARLNGWYGTMVYALVIAVVGFSLVVAWQLYSLLLNQFGIQDVTAQAAAVPAQLLTQLTQQLPESRYVVDFFMRVHTQLMWLLLAAILWAGLDKWNPQIGWGRRQQA